MVSLLGVVVEASILANRSRADVECGPERGGIPAQRSGFFLENACG